MSFPTPSPVLYATIDELRTILDGTDAGTGTASQLTDDQLTLAVAAGSNRVSAYSGIVWDSSQAAYVPPGMAHDLALDIAAFWAARTYMKSRNITPQHPIWLGYTEAMKVLEDVRDGKVRMDPQPAGSPGLETGHVINRIPNIFTMEDSNTRINPLTETLEASVPPDMLVSGWDDWDAVIGGGF